MAGEKHLYVVASGGYVSSAPALANEVWQTGVRLLMVPGSAPPTIGPIDNTWDVVADSVNRVETNWTITSNWTTEAGVSDFNPSNWLNDQAGPAFKAWLATAGLFSSSCQLRTLKLYPIQAPDGKVVAAPPYLQGSPALLTYTGTLPTGSQSGALLPTQNSIVASLRTNQVGRRGRGRMYSPPSAVGAMGTSTEQGTIGATTRAAMATAYKTLLEAIGLDGSASGVWCFPIVTGAPYLNYAGISNVRIGNIMDGQTRRRNALNEVYSDQPVTIPS